jgi:hypothetical protein
VLGFVPAFGSVVDGAVTYMQHTLCCCFFLFSCLIMVSLGHGIIFSSSISIETHTSGVVC